MDDKGINQIEKIIVETFCKYAPDAPKNILENIESRSGIKLHSINKINYEILLEELTLELSKMIEPWKAKFVIGVMRQLIKRQF